MSRWVILFVILFSHAYSIKLIDQFSLAQRGDFFVLNHKSTSTLMVIGEITTDRLLLEEISAPFDAAQLKTMDIKKWVEQKAPGHTSWVQTALKRSDGSVIKAYCRVRSSYLASDTDQQFITTLLNLNFHPVPKEEQKRCGAAGGSDDLLPRKLWQPPKPKGLESALSTPYFAYWPKDGTGLAGQRIEVYLLAPRPDTPAYFPIWIEVRRANLKGRIRVLEIGTHLELRPGRSLQ